MIVVFSLAIIILSVRPSICSVTFLEVMRCVGVRQRGMVALACDIKA
jgi:hypothetical protein